MTTSIDFTTQIGRRMGSFVTIGARFKKEQAEIEAGLGYLRRGRRAKPQMCNPNRTTSACRVRAGHTSAPRRCVESIEWQADWASLAPGVFTEREFAVFKAAGTEAQCRLFYQLWTRKEA
jgi:hypothetical protein